MKPIIYPWKMQSKSAKLLAKAISTKRISWNTKFKNSQNLENHTIINWGSSKRPNWIKPNKIVLNVPEAVAKSVNKLKMYRALSNNNVPTLKFTTSKETAKEWITNFESYVYCRTILTGSGGKGIVVAHNINELVDAPVYTKGLPKTFKEYRVHVFQDEIIDITQKKRKRNTNYNTLIRSHKNGWIYARTNVVLPSDMYSIPIDAISALGLDFGAVDLAVGKNEDWCLVIEVNTAPGLTGTTLEKYVDKIKSLV